MRYRFCKTIIAAGLLASALSAACTSAGDDRRVAHDRGTTARVTGTVAYRERIALVGDTEVHVHLLDVSRQDVAAIEVAKQVIKTGGQQVPFHFEIRYDPVEIDSRHTYAMRAEIVINGERRFMSTTHYPVITLGAPTDVDILVVQVRDGAVAPPVSSRLIGMFSYMADSGFFTECGTSRRVAVAHEGDNAALERAYSLARKEPAAQMLVTVRGQYAQRPRMEGKGTRETLVVDRFERVWPEETCEKSTVETPLTDTYWKLVELNGKVHTTHPDQRRDVHLQLRAQQQRAEGFAGCNAFSGGFELRDGILSFKEMASTMMACPHLDEEQAFLAALQSATGFEILGETLLLMAEEGVLARFRAVYLE